MKKICFIIVLSAAFITKPKNCLGNNYPVTVTGHVFGFDWSDSRVPGIRFPLAGARIELMDSDADGSQLFDDVMGTAVVNADGSFTVTGSGGDPGDFGWSKPDVYVRFIYNFNDKVRLTDELDRTRYANTPEHEHDNFQGTLDIGTWTIGMDISSGEASKSGVWNKVCESWNDYTRIMGEEPKSGYCDAEYWSAIYAGTPWTSDNTIHWPIHYTSSAARHEFGHLIRHSFDGDRDHFNWDVTRFRYARTHNPCDADCDNWATESAEMNMGYAFNEGWAEFWAEEYYYNCSAGFSAECEGGVAYTLRFLEDSLRNIYPEPRKMMCQVLKNNPGVIHSMAEYINKLNEMAGKTLFALTGYKLPEVKKNPDAMAFRPIPKESAIATVNRDLKNIIAEISSLDNMIKEKTSGVKPTGACRGESCNIYADQVMSLSGLENKRDLLRLQQDMLQKSIQNNYYDIIPGKFLDKSYDIFIKEMREYYNGRINELNQAAFKTAISRLKNIKAVNPYITGLANDLQQKMNLLQQQTNQAKFLSVQGFKPYDNETMRRSD